MRENSRSKEKKGKWKKEVDKGDEESEKIRISEERVKIKWFGLECDEETMETRKRDEILFLPIFAAQATPIIAKFFNISHLRKIKII